MKTVIAALAFGLALIAAAALAEIEPAKQANTANLVGPCTGCQAAWGSHD